VLVLLFPSLVDEDDAGMVKTLFSWRVVVTLMARNADIPKDNTAAMKTVATKIGLTRILRAAASCAVMASLQFLIGYCSIC
jgi:hypothetical protein